MSDIQRFTDIKAIYYGIKEEIKKTDAKIEGIMEDSSSKSIEGLISYVDGLNKAMDIVMDVCFKEVEKKPDISRAEKG